MITPYEMLIKKFFRSDNYFIGEKFLYPVNSRYNVYRYLVVAVAYEQFIKQKKSVWFSTKEFLNYLPSIDRRFCSTITNSLRRGVKLGNFTEEKREGRWYFKITPEGKHIGRWAVTVASDFDKDVQLYTMRSSK